MSSLPIPRGAIGRVTRSLDVHFAKAKMPPRTRGGRVAVPPPPPPSAVQLLPAKVWHRLKQQRQRQGKSDDETARVLERVVMPRVSGATTDTVREYLQKLLNIVNAAKQQGGQVGVRSYELLGSKFERYGKGELLRALLEQAEAEGVPRTPRMTASLLLAYVNSKQYAEAARLVSALDPTNRARSRPISEAVLRYYSKAGDEAAVLVHLQDMAKHRRLNSGHFSTAMAVCTTYKAALDLFSIVGYNAVPLDLRLLNALLGVFAKNGDTIGAVKILNEALRRDSLRGNDGAPLVTSSSFVAAMKSCSVHDFATAVSLKQRMIKVGISPCAHVYSMLLSIIFRRVSNQAGDTPEAEAAAAERLFEEAVGASTDVKQNPRVWGKTAEILGVCKLSGRLEAHAKRWAKEGPRFTKGSLEVLRSAYKLCGSSREGNVAALIQKRDEYYAKEANRNTLRPHTMAREVDRVSCAADSVPGEPEESPGGAQHSTIVIFGFPSHATEQDLLRFVKGCGKPTLLLVLHSSQNTVCRVYVEMPDPAGQQMLLSLHLVRFKGKVLRILRATGPSSSYEMTDHQRRVLAIDPMSLAAERLFLHRTPLSDSCFKPQNSRHVPVKLYSSIPRSLRR